MKTFLSMLALFFLYESAQAICAAPKHPQEAFCKSDFVFFVNVTSGPHTDTRLIFPVSYLEATVTHVFKGFPLIQQYGLKVRLYEASPGYLPRISGSYMVSGRHNGLWLTTSICEWVTPVRELTIAQRRGLTRLYRVYCRCRISSCITEEMCSEKKSNECQWVATLDSMLDKSDCQSRAMVCKSFGHGCDWVDMDDTFEACSDAMP